MPDLLGGKDQFDEVTIDLHRTDKSDPETHEEAMAMLRIDLKSKDPNLEASFRQQKSLNWPWRITQDFLKATTRSRQSIHSLLANPD